MARWSAVFVFLAVSLLCAVTAQQKQPAPRFRTGAEAVVVDVSVLDRDRRPVHGLSSADFTVLEDGRPQKIDAFQAVDIPDVEPPAPAAAAWVRQVPPDVQRNDEMTDGRIVVVVMDDALPMPAPDVQTARKAARTVIESLGPRDVAAVVFVLNKMNNQDFTRDRQRLFAAVDRFVGATSRDMKFDDQAYSEALKLKGDFREARYDEFVPSRMSLYTWTLDTLQDAARNLAELPDRRKALVYVSVGIPLDPEQMAVRGNVDGGNASDAMLKRLRDRMDGVFDAARRANVVIYGIDPGGLRAPYDTNVATVGAGNRDVLLGDDRVRKDANPGRLNKLFLNDVSVATGGFAIADTNDPAPGIAQAVRENGSYYLLGYQSPNTRAQGRYRKIEVRVNRPGMQIRARKGYYEPGGPATQPPMTPTNEALNALVPKTDIGMQVTVAPFAIAGTSDAALAIALALQQPAVEGTERSSDDVSVLIAALDPAGRAKKANKLGVHLTLRPGSETTCEVLSRLDLPPGRYRLRVGATSAAQNKSGSVFYDVDVPDFSKAALSLSGVVMSATTGVKAGGAEALASLLPVVPTAARTWSAGDSVEAFVRVYQGGNGPVGGATITARIIDKDGKTVMDRSEPLPPERFSSDRAADYRVDLPLDRLEPGPHLLTIEAKLGDRTERRDVRVTIR